MAIIRMRDHLYDEIVNYAKEHLPEEACGLLAGVETGEGREIRKVYFLENKDHSARYCVMVPIPGPISNTKSSFVICAESIILSRT